MKKLSILFISIGLIACSSGGGGGAGSAPQNITLLGGDLVIEGVTLSSDPMPAATRIDASGTVTIVQMPDGRTAIEVYTTVTTSPVIETHLEIDGQHLINDNQPSNELTINVCDQLAAQTGVSCTAACVGAANNISNCQGPNFSSAQLTSTIQGAVAGTCSLAQTYGLWPDPTFGNTADEFVFNVFFTGAAGFPGILSDASYSGVTCDTSCDRVTYTYWENSPGTGPIITDPGVNLVHADGTITNIPGSGTYQLDGISQVTRDSVSCN
ncbi:MAG: hypothetical protein OEY36_02125 [Gammaproteobacteria bacterium]|nr:hypothetical protein [Gammaproteobacteria bacterium]